MIKGFIAKKDIKFPKHDDPKIMLLVKKGRVFEKLESPVSDDKKYEKNGIYSFFYRYDERKPHSENNTEIIVGRKSAFEKEPELYKPIYDSRKI